MIPVEIAAIAVFAPLGGAAVLMVVAPLRQNPPLATSLSVLGALASLGASAWLLFELLSGEPGAIDQIVQRQWVAAGDTTVARIGLRVDATSVPMMFVVSFVAAMVQIFSHGYLHGEPDADRGRYYTWQSLFLFSMMGLVVAPNLLQLFLCWELVGMCSYLLIGYWWRKPEAAKAAVKAFWVTKFADMGLLAALIAMYVRTGSFEWSPEVVAGLAGNETVPSLTIFVAGLLFFAVMGKSAQFPLHVWLPDAMEGPTPVSALLHAATMVAAGVYLVVRAWPLFVGADEVLQAMAIIGGTTALFGASMAIVQTDIKRVLAYSTVSQLGYMIAALGAGSLLAGYFHLVTHAFFKALLFLAAGSVIHAVHTNDLSDMGGLFRPMKLTAAMFAVGAAALAGVPFLSGFVSKDLVLESLYEAARNEDPLLWFPFLACFLTVGLTAYYMTYVLFGAFFGKPSRRAYRAKEGDWSMRIPMLLLAVPSLGAGFAISMFADQLALTTHGPLHLGGVGALGIVAALVGIATALGVLFSRGGSIVNALTPLGTVLKLGPINWTYDWIYRRTLQLSQGVGWFDRYMIDGVVNVVGEATLRLGQWSRQLQTGRVADYVYAVVGGLVLLAAWSQVMAWVGVR